MNVYLNIDNLPTFKNSVITIGSFDGVHLGHQQLIKRINTLANQHNGESILITFHPHPRTIIQSKNKIYLLQSLDEKIEILEKTGLNNLVVVPFTREFSQQSPQDYIENFLVKLFNPKVIVIGYNHKFGKNRKGDILLLESLKQKFNYQIEQITKQQIENLSISSTEIRNALLKGNIEIANNLLGRHFSIEGIVVKGEQIGRKIGFPTANIFIDNEHKLIPQQGVYAVKVKMGSSTFNGMLNIGNRPTVNGISQTIEVHIFDFNQEIYGEKIKIEFVKFIRSEIKFDLLINLKKQLETDKQTCLKYLL